MMSFRSARRSACALSFLTVWLLALTSPAQAESIKAITTNGLLISFDSATPGTLTTQVALTGLAAGETILGIDIRPATGALYGLGSANSLYSIDATTAAATLVANGAFMLNGTSFGFDFNPTTDRIRVTSDLGQNLRLNPDTGAPTIDSPLNGATTRVTGSAYTNNFSGALTTMLYGLDDNANALFLQGNPNGGVLTAVGSLGFDFSESVGFDISGQTGIAYAALSAPTGASSSLFTLNLTTGTATLIGTIGTPGVRVASLAAPVGTAAGDAVPEPTTLVLMTTGLAGAARRWRAACRRR
jgi:hypothetical protein